MARSCLCVGGSTLGAPNLARGASSAQLVRGNAAGRARHCAPAIRARQWSWAPESGRLRRPGLAAPVAFRRRARAPEGGGRRQNWQKMIKGARLVVPRCSMRRLICAVCSSRRARQTGAKHKQGPGRPADVIYARAPLISGEPNLNTSSGRARMLTFGPGAAGRLLGSDAGARPGEWARAQLPAGRCALGAKTRAHSPGLIKGRGWRARPATDSGPTLAPSARLLRRPRAGPAAWRAPPAHTTPICAHLTPT